MDIITDMRYMDEAVQEARKALLHQDVPIGAVVVCHGEIVGCGHNTRENSSDPTGHAEINALRDAGRNLGHWRLDGCVIYVTHEPCPMCAGACMLSHISAIVYGADEPAYGVCGSQMNLVQYPGFPQNCLIRGPVDKERCEALTRDFFESLRHFPPNE